MSWLDSQAAGSVLFVSLSTLLPALAASRPQFAQAMHMIEQFILMLGYRTIFTLGGDKKVRTLLSESFLDACGSLSDGDVELHKPVLLLEEVPQSCIIAHPSVRAVLTHCGWGATQEILTLGVPAITYPWGWDQPSNEKLLQRLGVCFSLRDRLSPLLVQGGDDFQYQSAYQKNMIVELEALMPQLTTQAKKVSENTKVLARSEEQQLLGYLHGALRTESRAQSYVLPAKQAIQQPPKAEKDLAIRPTELTLWPRRWELTGKWHRRTPFGRRQADSQDSGEQ